MPTTSEYLKELTAESVSARKCLQNIPAEKFDFKPHPTSMNMGYLASLVAEIPLWITYMIKEGEIDFATFKHREIKTAEDLTNGFEENLAGAIEALKTATDDQLSRTFYLRNKGEELFSAPVGDYIGNTINHWIHHRGQLTVYMRVCEIPVPSIYGPSADDKHY